MLCWRLLPKLRSNHTTFENSVAYRQLYKDPGVRRIVALTHIGYDQDIALVKANNISLIIGGHYKGPYPTIVKKLDGDEVFVFTSFRWGSIWVIDVELIGGQV